MPRPEKLPPIPQYADQLLHKIDEAKRQQRVDKKAPQIARIVTKLMERAQHLGTLTDLNENFALVHFINRGWSGQANYQQLSIQERDEDTNAWSETDKITVKGGAIKIGWQDEPTEDHVRLNNWQNKHQIQLKTSKKLFKKPQTTISQINLIAMAKFLKVMWCKRAI